MASWDSSLRNELTEQVLGSAGHMSPHLEHHEHGIVGLTADHPPVNALPAHGRHELAEAVATAGADRDTLAVVLAAEGRGINAGVDIEELAAEEGHDTLVAVNEGCYKGFKNTYECPVPVISAVHGFCLGGVSDRARNDFVHNGSPETTDRGR